MWISWKQPERSLRPPPPPAPPSSPPPIWAIAATPPSCNAATNSPSTVSATHSVARTRWVVATMAMNPPPPKRTPNPPPPPPPLPVPSRELAIPLARACYRRKWWPAPPMSAPPQSFCRHSRVNSIYPPKWTIRMPGILDLGLRVKFTTRGRVT
jgi:hypothetical protein